MADTRPLTDTDRLELGGPPAAVCQVTLRETGARLAVEEEYLAGVVACENGNASDEALRAQAVAARSWLYVFLRTHSSVCNSQACQVFSCGRPPTERHRRAVRDTAGEVLMHDGNLVQSFYVAGVRRGGPTCSTVLPSSDAGVRTEPYTTPGQQGRTGDAVRIAPPPLSSGIRVPENRGCMSQNGADCLDREMGYDYERILRYYYGGDVEVVQAVGACVAPSVPDGGCVHSAVGGAYPDGGCTASYQCVTGSWRARAASAECTCVETSGAGCEVAPPPPPPPASGTCVHTFGGVYSDGGCTAGYYCEGGTWRARAASDVCSCVETSGMAGCSAAAGASCTHSFGGVYADGGCTASYRCDDGRWFTRSAGDAASCGCIETTGRLGCGAAPAGASCTHTFGGVYRDGACTASYWCDDGAWRRRDTTTSCACVESSGASGC